MCGIAGFQWRTTTRVNDAPEAVRRMCQRMAKRGPDAEAVAAFERWHTVLGHRRLAIIDLDPRANQPLVKPDAKCAIVFNGEIYNYRELRRTLESAGETFATESDTEVLLALYRRHGKDMLPMLRGMFAFAVLDLDNGSLFLARDPYGIKPLYYTDTQDGVAFASSVKALQASGIPARTLDPAGLVGFYLWGSVPEPRTLFREIHALPAGHFLRVRAGQAETPTCWRDIATAWRAPRRTVSAEALTEIVREALGTGPGPDMDVNAELLRIGGLTTPPSTSTARGTWITYEGFGTQAPLVVMPDGPGLLPIEGRYYVGVDLPANPLWPASDGHALFRADLLSANTPATVGENERLGAPDPTWGGSVGGVAYSTPWTYILGPLVTSPNLHVGGIDTLSSRLGAPGANIGMNGLYPDIMGLPRCDGLMFRISDSLAPDGLVFMGAQFGFQPPQFVWSLVGTLIGHNHIAGSSAVPIGMTTLTLGSVEIPVALPNTIPTAMIGSDVVFQSIVWDTTINLAEWTNGQAVHL